MIRLWSFIFVVSLFGLVGCVSFPQDYVEFRKLPKDVRKEKFRGLPLEKQVDCYGYCWTASNCEQFYSDIIAGQGKTALPYLLARMKQSDDSEKFEISVILEKMHNEYVKIDDDETIMTLKIILNDMEDPVWKEMTKNNLAPVLHIKKSYVDSDS